MHLKGERGLRKLSFKLGVVQTLSPSPKQHLEIDEITELNTT